LTPLVTLLPAGAPSATLPLSAADSVGSRVGTQGMLVLSTLLTAIAIIASGLALDSAAAFVVIWALCNLVRTLYQGAHGGYIGVFIPERLRTRVTGIGEFR
jgi:hypothetical protein